MVLDGTFHNTYERELLDNLSQNKKKKKTTLLGPASVDFSHLHIFKKKKHELNKNIPFGTSCPNIWSFI